jgi:hypothetical protein
MCASPRFCDSVGRKADGIVTITMDSDLSPTPAPVSDPPPRAVASLSYESTRRLARPVRYAVIVGMVAAGAELSGLKFMAVWLQGSMVWLTTSFNDYMQVLLVVMTVVEWMAAVFMLIGGVIWLATRGRRRRMFLTGCVVAALKAVCVDIAEIINALETMQGRMYPDGFVGWLNNLYGELRMEHGVLMLPILLPVLMFLIVLDRTQSDDRRKSQ